MRITRKRQDVQPTVELVGPASAHWIDGVGTTPSAAPTIRAPRAGDAVPATPAEVLTAA